MSTQKHDNKNTPEPEHSSPDAQKPQSGTETPSASTEKRRSLMPLLKKTAMWIVILLVMWWGASLVIPGIPAPAEGGKALFYVLKGAGDAVYYSANEGSLEESARKVREESSAYDPNANHYMEDSISAERLKRMPILSNMDDSAIRSGLISVSSAPPIRGRVFNVLIMGIDSRMGVRDARADAIHLATISPDSGIVEILSIPRDTYCDLGFPDTTTFNIIANARAQGYSGFCKRVQELAHRGPVNYYVEVGFSQAMGVLEILGYNNPVSTLRFLRTRKTLPGGDLQRAHNQARFMADNLKSKFHLLTGSTGELFLSAGLQFVTTNLSKDICQGLIYNLQKAGFPNQREDAVRLRLLSPTKIRLREMSADSATVSATLSKVEQRLGDNTTEEMDIATRLRRINTLAIADSSRPHNVIHRLSRICQQRGWIQVQSTPDRLGIRDTMLTTLRRAYEKLGKTDEIKELDKSIHAEDFLMNHNR